MSIQGLLAFELGGVFRSLRRIAGAIGVRAHTREFAALHDQILVANRTVLEVALEDFPGSCCVARLRRQTGPRNMRRHAVMRHGAPRMILRRRLWGPDITRIAG